MNTRATNDLRSHPDNARIYGDHADTDLIESIRAKGILNPLLITSDGRVISGNRRLEAARRLNLSTVPVVLYGSNDELDILEALIESNRQRHKTNEQLGREADALMSVEAERARRRQAVRSVLLSENFPEVKPGRASDVVGEKLGVSGKQVEKAATVVRAIDGLAQSGKKREAEQLRSTLNNKSVHAAYSQAREAGHIAPAATPQKPATIPDYYTLDQWRMMSEAEQWSALNAPRNRNAKMNSQDGDNIEWALWSWNPVTGCLHNCSYCYARDIADRFYTQKFAPSFIPGRLSAPANTPVPAEAARNLGHKNVFTCSMADLFGRWVPREWIEAVLQTVADNPQWNFLFLTKFPVRLSEFEFPANAWLGTTVDAQARVANAERAFSKVRGGVKWLSCEPLLEPLTFSSLDMFDWVVIGGASKSTQTPEFRPPREWVQHLEGQARRAGCKVYEKTNLLERIKEYPGQTDAQPVNVPDEFKMTYLQRDVLKPSEYQHEFAA